MGSPDLRGLSGQAGPRITAASTGSGLRLLYDRDLEKQDSYTFDIRTASHFGFDSFYQLLPWPLRRQIRPRGRFFAFCAAALCATAVAAVALPWFWTLAPAGLLLWLIHEEWHSDLRKSKRILEDVELELALGASLDELRPAIEDAVRLDAYNDGARLLLSCALLEAREDVGALVQLAPLRDHHPHSGEVLLIAAATYLHLNRADDALRMLEALSIRPSHSAYLPARRMLEETRSRLGLLDRNELPHWGSPLAEELLPEA